MSQPPDDKASGMIEGDAGTELASNRTGLSFERTQMAADRTLMATVRTSLSLISFGFTINQVFDKAKDLLPMHVGGRRLGLALLLLGIAALVMGIVTHASFGRQLAARRERLYGLGLLRRAGEYHVTATYVIAVLLLAIGVFALISITFKVF